MSYYSTCPHCGANLDPGERCDCIQAKIDQLFERIPTMPLSELEWLLEQVEKELAKREAAQGATNTQSGKTEQIVEPVSITILTAPKEVVNHDC